MRAMETVITLLIRIVEFLFVVGAIGSVAVWLLTAAELVTVLGRNGDDAPSESGSGGSETAV